MATTEPGDGLAQPRRTVTSIVGYVGADALNSLLIRTDFTDHDAWDALADSVTTPIAVPDVEGGWASPGDLVLVNDPTLNGYDHGQLVELLGNVPPFYIFIADSESMTADQQTVAAVELDTTEPTTHPLRVALDALWMIENSLLTATMPFADFVASADSDGIFRGFDTATRPESMPDRPTNHVTISKKALQKALTNSPADDNPARAALHAQWDTLDFDELTFYRLPAHSVLTNLRNIDPSTTASSLGYNDAVKALNRDGDVLAGSYNLPNGYWEIYLDPNARTPIAVYQNTFK